MIKAENKHYVLRAMGHESTKATASGIIIQNTEETELAEIVSAGPAIEAPLAVGTRVVISWGAVVQVRVEGEKYFVIHADNILASVA
jgi:co-chaperonin GroES (HSP10)